jgi:hypothetical protein
MLRAADGRFLCADAEGRVFVSALASPSAMTTPSDGSVSVAASLQKSASAATSSAASLAAASAPAGGALPTDAQARWRILALRPQAGDHDQPSWGAWGEYVGDMSPWEAVGDVKMFDRVVLQQVGRGRFYLYAFVSLVGVNAASSGVLLLYACGFLCVLKMSTAVDSCDGIRSFDTASESGVPASVHARANNVQTPQVWRICHCTHCVLLYWPTCWVLKRFLYQNSHSRCCCMVVRLVWQRRSHSCRTGRVFEDPDALSPTLRMHRHLPPRWPQRQAWRSVACLQKFKTRSWPRKCCLLLWCDTTSMRASECNLFL